MLEWFKTHKAIWISSLVTLLVIIAGGTYWWFSPGQQAKRSEQAQQELAQKSMYANAPHKKVHYSKGVKVPDFETLMQQRKDRDAQQGLYLRGEVSIPKVKLETPILEGIDQNTLAWGAGTAKPAQKMGHGNYAMSAHNMLKATYAKNWLFSNLQTKIAPAGNYQYDNINVELGTKIYLYDGKRVYTYETSARNIVNASDPHSIDVIKDQPGAPMVTLTTCLEQKGIQSPDQRIIIQGTLTDIHKTKDFKHFDKVFTDLK